MDRKLIFLDIDGTLITAMKKPSPQTVRAVRGARAKGHKVFVCTGRNMPIIGEDIRAVGFDGIISSAGGHVEVEDKVLFDHLLPEDVIQECLSLFHEHGVYSRIENQDGIYTDPQMEALLRAAKADRGNSELIRMQREIEAGIPIRPYEQYPKKGAYKICFTASSLEAVEETKPYEALIDMGSNIVELKKFPTRPTANSITATSKAALAHMENKYFTGLRLAICFSLKSLEIFSSAFPLYSSADICSPEKSSFKLIPKTSHKGCKSDISGIPLPFSHLETA